MEPFDENVVPPCALDVDADLDVGVLQRLDELKASNASLSLCLELQTFQQLAFKGGEEALADVVIIAVTSRSHRRAHAHFFAAKAERHGCVLGSLVAMMNDAIRLALRHGHVHRVDDEMCLLIVAHGPANDAAAKGIQTAPPQYLITIQPVRGLVLRRRPTVHASRLPCKIHVVSPQPFCCNESG